MTAPLSGMRVIESSAFVAAPLAGMTLAQMGAEVIRVDRLQGGLDAARWPVTESGASLFWAGMNKGKRSVAIDLSAPEGVELMAALITAPGPGAGLFLTNLRGKGPLDYPALSARRPDLIMVSLIGTRRGEPAVDYTINPSLGFPLATGPAGMTEPVGHVLPAWDCITGQMLVGTLLAAERHRLRTGEGQLAELALKDVAAAMLGHLGIIAEVQVNGVDRPRHGNALYGAYGQDFLCADGQRIMVVGLTDRQWRGLVKVTGIGPALEAEGLRLEGEGDRWHARDRITAHLAPWFAARTGAEVARLFDAAGLTWGPYRSFAGAVAEDPDLSEDNPMFARIEQPGIGPYLMPGSPVAWSGFQRRPPSPAPRLGQDSEAVLAEVLGLGSGQIGALIDRGIVAQA
ncbi:MAG: CoA transferase [Tabrizicola sp.]